MLYRRPPYLAGPATMAAGGALFCGAALINGGPFIYPDTTNYLADGHALIRLGAPGNVRPVFYGLATEFLHGERNVWPVLVAQALVLVHLVSVTLRVIDRTVPKRLQLLLFAALAILTPVSWYVAYVLPDVFTAVVALTLYLLGCCRDRLTRAETIYLTLLGAAAISFHLTHLILAGAITGAWWLLWLAWRAGRPMLRPPLASIPLLLAVLGLLTSSEVLYQRLSLDPKSPPHLMARLIADGPGRDYLRTQCGTTPYWLCSHLDQLPGTENGILWRYMSGLPDADHRTVVAQAGDIVRGTIETYPVAVALHMLANTGRQLVSIGSGFEFDRAMWRGLEREDPFIASAARNSLQLRGLLTESVLTPLNTLHALVAAASLAFGLVFALQCGGRRLYRPALLVGVVLLSLLANAFATGALGGVFGRYEGRLIWLLPLSAAMAALALARSRRPVRTSQLQAVTT